MRPAATRPMGEVIGRQPTRIIVIPSAAPSPWYGAIVGGEKTGFGDHSIKGGQRFTEQQVEQMIKRGWDVLTAKAMTVRRNSTDAEIWSGIGQPRPVYEFECPIVHHRADGRVRVIAPSGDEKLVEGDGWITPWKRAWRGRVAS
jgi:hypothetical protein